MQANVYVVQTLGAWTVFATIDQETDRLFWMNDRIGERLGRKEEGASDGWLWKEALPLGDACRAAELWREKYSDGRGGRGGERAGTEDGERCKESESVTALESLASCIAEVKREAAGLSDAGWRARVRGIRDRAAVRMQPGDSLRRCAERWERAVSGGETAYAATAEGAKRAAELLQGRALLRSEAQALFESTNEKGAMAELSHGALQLCVLLGHVRLRGSLVPTMLKASFPLARHRRGLRCLRCGSGEEHLRRSACAACGRVCAYCLNCIQMGRSRECELLIEGLRPAISQRNMGGEALPSVNMRLNKWGLSPAQEAAAAKALHFVESSAVLPKSKGGLRGKEEGGSFLLWAVTGAGKTEMIFPLVESVLLRGGKALIATPRRDVVIELDPRIRKAFPSASVVTLYGGSEQRWESGDITLATTHQLLRFHRCFDLVVIDELDAFPFAGDPVLHYAADKSCAEGAARLLLSATPPPAMQRDARRGALPHARVPVRYHRHPLPVPKLLRTPAVAQMLQSGKLPAAVLKELRQSIHRGAQLFIFVQRIAQTEPMAALLRKELQLVEVAATSSQDDERADKVRRFRRCELRVLVTTTILERGITIPRSDVYIFDADGRLFDEASLVQMSGRAGRSADDPYGRVFFCSRERTRAQSAAVRHIRTMNRIARKSGYLLDSPAEGGRI